MIRNALSNALCRELGMEWRRRSEVVVIGEAYGIMKSTADAMDALREHSHASQIISEQKWKSCLAPTEVKSCSFRNAPVAPCGPSALV